MDFKVYNFESLDSTNEKAKSMVNFHPCPFVVSANTQTKGKGQRNKSFHSPKNKGLYISIVVDYPFSIKKLQTLNLKIGNLVSNLLNTTLEIKTHSVYPNDVYFKNKKLAGILTEGIFNPINNRYDAVIVGIGLNLFRDFNMPHNLKNIVISLEEITKGNIDKDELLNIFSHSIIQFLRKETNEK